MPGSFISLLLASVLIPFFVNLASIKLERISSLKLILANFILMYVLIVTAAFTYDSYLTFKLASFDLNGDSVFSDNEITEEQQLFMKLVVEDTARTLAPITGFVYCAMHSFMFFVILKCKKRFVKDIGP